MGGSLKDRDPLARYQSSSRLMHRTSEETHLKYPEKRVIYNRANGGWGGARGGGKQPRKLACLPAGNQQKQSSPPPIFGRSLSLPLLFTNNGRVAHDSAIDFGK